ncbi:MAG: HAD family hydrolase [Caldilineae bacterium]|nr:MAG: HAD family hydrolase [Caldilineae bacterium]
MIKAVTFDFWDTIAIDDSDEARRANLGLPSKPQARLQLFMDEILSHHPEVEPERIAQAYARANDWFRHCWKVEHHTPSVAERLDRAYAFLGLERTPGFDAVVQHIEEMEVRIPPDFAAGVHDVLKELARHYRLGIISDAIHTPGRGIRRLLADHGLLELFSAFVFSDEIGVSKPAPKAFEQAAAQLGVSLSEIVHIGDRESNDVAGPRALGMRAILFTGIVDRGSDGTQASALCRSYAELPALIARLG